MITLTDLAIAKIKEIAESEGIEKLIIRAKVLGGGCAGYQNDFYFDEMPPLETDEVIEVNDIKILIDQMSFQYMEHLTIDYQEGLISSGFTFNSPDITGSCGCGKSVSY